jgi:serine/threonine-protein kinase
MDTNPSPRGRPHPAAIGRYRILGELGRGAMGLVYKAEDTTLGRIVAVKTIELAFAVEPEQRAEFEARFMAEARIAARLSHPGIVVCHDVGKDAETGLLYIVLEHLEGSSLADSARPGSLLPTLQAVAIVAKIARALHYAHAHGVVHRDMKPANVIVLPPGDPKILDFGVAKLEGAQLTAAGQFFGSPLYMSPEQALARPVDARSDLFSLGSILYALLTGSHPFAAESIPIILTRIVGEDPPRPTRARPGLPESLDYVTARALAKSAGHRYASGQQMAEDLKDVAAGREPRHRATWVPDTGSHTMAGGAEDDPLAELVEEPPPGARPDMPVRPDTPVPTMPIARPAAPASAARPPAPKRSPPAHRDGPRFASARLRWAGAAAALVALVVAGVLLRSDGREVTRPMVKALPATTDERPGTPAAPREAAPPPSSSEGKASESDEPAELLIVLRHFVRVGQMRVFVNGERLIDTEIRAQQAKKLVAVTIREGRYTNTLVLPPGKHEIRVEVDWDEHRRALSTFASFAGGSRRTLDLELVRLTRELVGTWR